MTIRMLSSFPGSVNWIYHRKGWELAQFAESLGFGSANIRASFALLQYVAKLLALFVMRLGFHASHDASGADKLPGISINLNPD